MFKNIDFVVHKKKIVSISETHVTNNNKICLFFSHYLTTITWGRGCSKSSELFIRKDMCGTQCVNKHQQYTPAAAPFRAVVLWLTHLRLNVQLLIYALWI